MTKFSYGAYNRLTGLTDAKVHTTAYGYDPSGNNTSRTSPDLTAQSYTYDPSGELVAKTNRRGTPTQIIRDINGRILRIDYNDNTFVAYSYNSVGAIISVEDVTGITTMEYTDNHQLRRIIYPGDRFLEYTYDLAGRRASMLDHTGYLLNYAYNSDGLLESISDGTGITHAHYIYDPQGRLVSRTVGNGVSTIGQYDPAGVISAVDTFDDTGEVISYYHYEYDANDRRTKMTSLDGTWDYTYDATGQLVRALFTSTNGEVESKDIEYVYDAVGNRVSEIINGSPIEYSVNSMNQYNRAGAFSYLYDTDGNLIQKTDSSETWTYEYNADNRLIRSTGPEEDKVYIYNGLGQLATLIENGVERHYLVDPFGFGNIVGEYDKDGTRQSRYTHGLGLLGKDDYYYTFDGNGNTSELTDGTSEIVNYYLYEPFGKSLYALEQSENDFEYVGQFGIMRMNDDLVYMRNRFYSPFLGRFMAEDPIGLAGGDVSFYRYVLNDPVNLVDMDGLRPDPVCVSTYGLGGTFIGGSLGYYGGGILGGSGGTLVMPGVGTAGGAILVSEMGGYAGASLGSALGMLIGNAVCPEDDKDTPCEVDYKDCGLTSLADKFGGFGKTRCGLCKQYCEQNGGRWPTGRVFNGTGYVRCDYWNYPSVQ